MTKLDKKQIRNILSMRYNPLDSTTFPYALKTDFTESDFKGYVNNFLKVSKARHNKYIFKALMSQDLKDGIVSGLGNYLTPEILYDCKISPFRPVGDLSDNDIKKLSKSIKKIIKLSYYNNVTGYMTAFGDFIHTHKERIDNGTYPTYHSNVKLKENEEFSFKVYRQKQDPNGHDVDPNKDLNPGRTTYWVPTVQI